jgi:hypothetical protein
MLAQVRAERKPRVVCVDHEILVPGSDRAARTMRGQSDQAAGDVVVQNADVA